MRALRLTRHLPAEGLTVTDAPRPAPSPGELLIRVAAAGVNPSDVKYAAGIVPATPLPRIAGRDFAGFVEDGPAEWVGKAVYAGGGNLGVARDGGHAEYIALKPSEVALKPDGLDMAQAAGVGTPYVTAYQAVAALLAVGPGDALLILGGTGAVGAAAGQIARWRGARVLAAARNPAEPGAWRASADEVIDASRSDIAEQVKAVTGGRGADAVLNAAGAMVFEAGVDALGHGGRMVCISATGERRVSFDLMSFYKRELRWYGLDTLELSAAGGARVLEAMRPGFESGALRPPTGHALPLERAAEAYAMVGRGGAGKIVLTMV